MTTYRNITYIHRTTPIRNKAQTLETLLAKSVINITVFKTNKNTLLEVIRNNQHITPYTPSTNAVLPDNIACFSIDRFKYID